MGRRQTRLTPKLRVEIEWAEAGETARQFDTSASEIDWRTRALIAEAESAELTKALTGLTRGGSEYFIRKGDRFTADISACVAYVREVRAGSHRAILDAIKAKNEALAQLTEAGELVHALQGDSKRLRRERDQAWSDASDKLERLDQALAQRDGAVKALGEIKRRSNPTIRIERPRHELDDIYDIAASVLASQGESGKADQLSSNPGELPADVVRLVIAARKVAFGDHPAEAIDELDHASEAFASRVPWDDEPVTTAPALVVVSPPLPPPQI